MGWNTTVVILNDYLDQIERDPEFGKHIVFAIKRLHDPKDKPLTVAACGAPVAALVVETHDSEYDLDVVVGHNTAKVKRG